MLLHNDPSFSIYFGDGRNALSCTTKKDADSLCVIKQYMGADSLVFLKQVHGTQGVYIEKATQDRPPGPKERVGDLVLSDKKSIGIGVLTADCLPIVLYDTVKHCISVVHAGWRGSVSRVAIEAVHRMKQQFSSRAEDIQCFLGPSARVCCYEVAQDFCLALEVSPFFSQVLQKKEKKLFFDLPLLNILQLRDCGIKKENIHQSYARCTICDDIFCSYRRQGVRAGRQATVAMLK